MKKPYSLAVRHEEFLVNTIGDDLETADFATGILHGDENAVDLPGFFKAKGGGVEVFYEPNATGYADFLFGEIGGFAGLGSRSKNALGALRGSIGLGLSPFPGGLALGLDAGEFLGGELASGAARPLVGEAVAP